MPITWDEAMAELRTMVAADSDPTLTDAQLTQALNRGRVPDALGNRYTNDPLTAGEWEADAPVFIGQTILVSGRYWICDQTGTTGSTIPTFPTNLRGGPVENRRVHDGTAVWIDGGTEWAPTYSLNLAASWGWRFKAALASDRYMVGADGQQFMRNQVFANCLEMEARYRARRPKIIEVRR